MAAIVQVVIGGLVRAQDDSPSSVQPPTPLEAPAESNVETTPKTVVPERSAEDAVWPPPFNPSEEIGADSQVSFPTDI